MNRAELSIVVPILNELSQLPDFLADLQRQQQVDFELLMVDGGSGDGSSDWLQDLSRQSELPLSLLKSPAGRGRQLNLGGRQSAADWLLFLHVDSRFDDPLALRKSLDRLQHTDSQLLAGHFSLNFRRAGGLPSAGYYYYQWKARLGREETIHGDQGFLLRRDLYRQLGGFREDLPAMEDTDFAERLRSVGQWQLLSAEISTSARRFETEGLWQRQLLGALMMCFRSVGWDDFFVAAPDVYRQQGIAGRLRIAPFFQLVKDLFDNMERAAAVKLWWQCGCYVRRHAWQLAFAVDARREFRRGVPAGRGRPRVTERFEPLYDLLTDNLLGKALATVLLRLWFQATDAWLRRKESSRSELTCF